MFCFALGIEIVASFVLSLPFCFMDVFWGIPVGFVLCTFVVGVKMLWEISREHEDWKNLGVLNGLYQMEREE